MKNQVQLITYVDRLTAGGFADLKALIDGPLKGVIGGVHPLPFFDPIDGVDAGFDPIDHTLVDPRLGDWSDVKALAGSVEVMADLIVNHMSAMSPAFQDVLAKGEASECADLFLTFDKVFPNGATEAEITGLYRPRPGLPFTLMTLGDGRKRMMWTTFASTQMDIDVFSKSGEAYLDSILKRFSVSGITAIRLDAAGYAVKKPGTNCFMIPETFTFLGAFAEKAKALGMEVLVEIHSYYRDQIEIAEKVDLVYDFALPPLVLHGLFTGEAGPLAGWLRMAPRNAITVLDTHDGIGVIDVGNHPDGRPGLLTEAQIDNLIDTMHARTQGQSREATIQATSKRAIYQVNSTYYDALGKRDEDYLIARALQFFAPGIPQVYYVGLLGGLNDMELLRKTKGGRDINRHHYTPAEVTAALEKPMVRALFDLIRFRNTHPAFGGAFTIEQPSESTIVLTWRLDDHMAALTVDFRQPRGEIVYSDAGRTRRVAVDGHFGQVAAETVG